MSEKELSDYQKMKDDSSNKFKFYSGELIIPNKDNDSFLFFFTPKEIDTQCFCGCDLNNGMKIPMIGLGTHKMVDPIEVTYNAIKEGIRLIDTATRYGNQKEVGEGVNDAIIDKTIIIKKKIMRKEKKKKKKTGRKRRHM